MRLPSSASSLRWLWRAALTLATALAVVVFVFVGVWALPSLAHGQGGQTSRPTSTTSQYAYTTPESVYSAGQVVVHYVTQGIDAPSLLDDDHDGVPDYVKSVADVANSALNAYRQRGFVMPPPDTGGPDGRLDVYIDALHGLGCGFSEPNGPQEDEGGYIVVNQLLDREPQGDALCSFDQTVSHEVFHIVQFAYPAGTLLPSWVSEGTATAMQLELYPNIHDQLLANHYAWGADEVATTICRRDPYSAAPFWQTLDEVDPHFLPYYFAHALGQTAADPCDYQELNRLLERQGHLSLAAVYEQMTIENADLLPVSRQLHLHVGQPGQAQGSVAPLASKDLALSYPLTGHTLTFTTQADVRLIVWVGGDIRRLAPGRHRIVVPVNDAAQGQGDVIINGSLKPGSYRFSVSVR